MKDLQKYEGITITWWGQADLKKKKRRELRFR